MEREQSKILSKKAQSLIPGGVNSPVRAFKAVGTHPVYIKQANGPFIMDVDGNSYIDYVCSWGPLVLGHCHSKVVAAIGQTVSQGTSFGAPHEGEILLAEEICRAMPWIEMLRLVNSGTEASMSAIRVARAATGRNKIIKFEGNYHGHADYLLAKAGSGVATFGLPDSSGVTPGMTADTLVARFNHLSDVSQFFEQHGKTIAAVILEPVAGNMGLVPPAPGFLQGLRSLTLNHQALLIFDEVMTGFRVSRNGAAGLYGVIPDLVCLGKIIGGGLPVGAYGGRQDLMKLVAPVGSVYQAGTLSGNPLAVAAGLATLKELTPELYESLESKGAILQKELTTSANKHGIPAQVNRVGSMLSIFFTRHSVTDSATAFSTDRKRYARFFQALLRRGIYLPPSALECWFISSAHDDEVLEKTLQAFTPAFQETLST